MSFSLSISALQPLLCTLPSRSHMPPTLRLTTSFDLLLIAIMYMFMCLHKYRHCLLSQSVYVVCVYIVSEYQTLTKKAGPYSKWRPSQKNHKGTQQQKSMNYGQAPKDTSTSEVLHLMPREHYRRRHRKIVRNRISGSLDNSFSWKGPKKCLTYFSLK